MKTKKEPAVIINNITKEYYLEKPKTLKNWFKNIFKPFKKHTVFKNFSLTINKGDFLVITGPNGSGKTTLLKLIAGITFPDRGEIKTFGKVVPLIELGAGFNYELTGLENIWINGTILGIEKEKLKKLIPKIIEFSELKEFINIPIKRYSTGMISKLAFIIAIYSEPEILILDEIFSVGDQEFVKKSIKNLLLLKNNGVTIIISTHFDKGINLYDKKINLKKIK
ncbi:MAG: ABC transporter ATP-binding protein [Microgenomates group bacterium]